MKKLLFILLTLAIPALLLAAEPIREWKTKSGKTIIEAAFDASVDSSPETVYLLKDGKRYKVPFEKLSQTDQDYVTKVRFKSRALDDDDVLEEVSDLPQTAVVPPGRRYALLIGVNEYAKPTEPLQYCVKDMELLAECLQRIGTPKENIILMTDNSSVEYRPTGGNIRRQIESVTSLMEPDDQLIIAFSGHGVMVEDKSYLCPSDMDSKNQNSVVSRDWVFEQLEKCKAKQKVFIIDACRFKTVFSGRRALGQPRTLEDPIGSDSHGFILIASCDKAQFSWESPEIQHGVFTYFFAEGLSGAAKNEEGYVTILSLLQYASSKTKMYVYRNLNEVQVPTFRLGGEATDFCLAKVDSELNEPRFHLQQSTHSLKQVSEDLSLLRSASDQTPSLDTPGSKAGERRTITVNGVEFAFRWCPPGAFMMGSPDEEEGRIPWEKRRQVKLDNGFWMLETEVTVGMFKAFVKEMDYDSVGHTPFGWNGEDAIDDEKYSWRNPGFNQDDNHPVTCVSRYDAVAFCKWLSKKIDYNITLPTEAQWEYACRAETTGAYAGNLDEMAWYNGKDGTHPVRMKKPNNWGLYDMQGNVCEWCKDEEKLKASPNPSPAAAANAPAPVDELIQGTMYVVRGSCWIDAAIDCRSASRSASPQDERSASTGFRVVTPTTTEDQARSLSSLSSAQPPSLDTPGSNAGERRTITVNGVEFAFRWCPPGAFMMGSPDDEEGRDDDETLHEVTLTKGFWMMETEVTQKQWNAVMESSLSVFKGDDLPVEMVSWNICQKFCEKTGFQLPTEAQWEYACRAGSTTAYFWGNALNGDKANCDGNQPCGTTINGKFLEKTTPVGSYEPNAWGLYDMHGNVWEWCQDWFGDYPSGNETDQLGPLTGSTRVIRGGSWGCNAGGCRSACRGNRGPKEQANFLGVRFLKSITTEDQGASSSPAQTPSLDTPSTRAGDRKVENDNDEDFAF